MTPEESAVLAKLWYGTRGRVCEDCGKPFKFIPSAIFSVLCNECCILRKLQIVRVATMDRFTPLIPEEIDP